jgi:hypothetical protein
MLEKLLGVGSLGSFIDHLTCHQATPLVSSNTLNFPFIFWTPAFTLLGCWALIVLALVIHFK